MKSIVNFFVILILVAALAVQVEGGNIYITVILLWLSHTVKYVGEIIDHLDE